MLRYVLYSKKELASAGKNTGHSTAPNVARLLRIDNPKEQFSKKDLDILLEIVEKCITCERFGSTSRRLRVACTQKYIFNKLLNMDIVRLVGREPILNMICCGTKLMITF